MLFLRLAAFDRLLHEEDTSIKEATKRGMDQIVELETEKKKIDERRATLASLMTSRPLIERLLSSIQSDMIKMGRTFNINEASPAMRHSIETVARFVDQQTQANRSRRESTNVESIADSMLKQCRACSATTTASSDHQSIITQQAELYAQSKAIKAREELSTQRLDLAWKQLHLKENQFSQLFQAQMEQLRSSQERFRQTQAESTLKSRKKEEEYLMRHKKLKERENKLKIERLMVQRELLKARKERKASDRCV